MNEKNDWDLLDAALEQINTQNSQVSRAALVLRVWAGTADNRVMDDEDKKYLGYVARLMEAEHQLVRRRSIALSCALNAIEWAFAEPMNTAGNTDRGAVSDGPAGDLPADAETKAVDVEIDPNEDRFDVAERLVNNFWHDFSDLVHRYLDEYSRCVPNQEGIHTFQERLGESTSVYGIRQPK